MMETYKTICKGEICTCGHTRAMHALDFAECIADAMRASSKRCTCVRFTWDAAHPNNHQILERCSQLKRKLHASSTYGKGGGTE